MHSVVHVFAQCCFHTAEVMAIFVRFFAYFGQNLVAMATSLRPLHSGTSFLNWPSTKNPVISNQILAISLRNAFVAILVAKIVAVVTRLCLLCMGVSQMNSQIAETPISNQTVHGYVGYN